MAAARPRNSSTTRLLLPLLRLIARHHRLLPPALVLFLFLPHLAALLLSHANSLGRRCLPPSSDLHLPDGRLNISIVTLSDEGESEYAVEGRSFRGVLADAAPNKRAYAAAHGYDLALLTAEALDPSRPPAWSKVTVLRDRLHRYDWLFWNDVDTLVTNPDISLERILYSVIGHSNFDASPDLVVTEDTNGINNGVFFIRRSKWSERFLDTWWKQTSFVWFGNKNHGDNAAMNLVIDQLSPEEMQAHVRIAKMQCLFNSYPRTATWKIVYRLIFHLSTTWKGAYSDGDFMVHFAGLDDKRGLAAKFLERSSVKRKFKFLEGFGS